MVSSCDDRIHSRFIRAAEFQISSNQLALSAIIPMNIADEPIERRRNRKLRILLLAEACNPTWTSIPLEAYFLARALAARDDLDVTLVSQVRNRKASKPIRSPRLSTYRSSIMNSLDGPFLRLANGSEGVASYHGPRQWLRRGPAIWYLRRWFTADSPKICGQAFLT